ncbi:Flavonoid 3',5'-methyltransferase [Acorus gramineus]|uniref:Flavonoid 3',5'-methyltransferase n=1 Tax=Acorus gramineus TaxID=55184 RepID=A0AAV9BV79_ACOGR|nr:Flavonoid 3',5'-methyltransferase [Acorus gramineus]
MAGFFQQKNLLQSDALHKYILETTVYPREHEQLRGIRNLSKEHPGHLMNLPPEEGQLLSLLFKLMNAKKGIEVGVFYGYSLLNAALALPEDGQVHYSIIAIDMDRETYEKGLPLIQKAGVENKIEFIHSDALQVLDGLIEEGSKEETFDFAFVDADKEQLEEYHKRLMKLVRVGGLIVYDNTLWYGTVAQPDNPGLPDMVEQIREALVRFNAWLALDAQVDLSLLCIGDGLTLCRRVC